jgi:hypothetical protein
MTVKTKEEFAKKYKIKRSLNGTKLKKALKIEKKALKKLTKLKLSGREAAIRGSFAPEIQAVILDLNLMLAF